MGEFRVVLRGLFPHLPGIGGEVDFIVAVVENTGTLGVKVSYDCGLFVFEEGFIGTHDLGVFLQALLDACAQLNEALDAIGRQKGVAANLLGLLANAVYPASPLDEADLRAWLSCRGQRP